MYGINDSVELMGSHCIRNSGSHRTVLLRLVKTMIDISLVLEKLKSRRAVFNSEADFQLEFGWLLKELYPDYFIRMEYCPKANRNMHIDILVITDNGWIPIELKYKTKSCILNVNDEEFVLKNHSAKDQSCYKYLKDIERIEHLKHTIDNFIEGYAIILTNERSYTSKPTKADCAYKDFSLHEGATKHGLMDWSSNASEGTKSGCKTAIDLKGSYTIHWEEYSKPSNISGGTFFVAVSKVV